MRDNSSTDLARAYLKDDFVLRSEDRAALESSLIRLGRELATIQDRDRRSAAYQEANVSLCRKRDALRKKFNVDASAASRMQINELAAHEEGSMMLNAFVLMNKGLATHIVHEFDEKQDFSPRRNYGHGDMLHAALYGNLNKTDEDPERKIKGLSGGLLSAAIHYNPDDSRALFSSYAGECIEKTLLKFIAGENDRRTVRLHDITDMHHKDALRLRAYGREEETVTQQIANAQRAEAVENALGKLTPREADVVRRRVMGDETRQEVGMNQNFRGPKGEETVTAGMVGLIEAKALRGLRHPARGWKLRPFADDDPEIGR